MYRSAWTAAAGARIQRRLFGEDPRRNRCAAGSAHSGRTPPPPLRSAAPANRTRLHRAVAEGLLGPLPTVIARSQRVPPSAGPMINSATKQSILSGGRDGLLRGACHRAALCADPLARNDGDGVLRI